MARADHKYWEPGEGCTQSSDGSYSDEAFHAEFDNPEADRKNSERSIQMAMREWGYSREEAEKVFGPGTKQ
jgi:hypothetical protein